MKDSLLLKFGVLVSIFIFTAFGVFKASTLIKSTNLNQTSDIKDILVSQAPAVVGQPIKWTKTVKISDLNNSQHILQIPKIASNVKISTSTEALLSSVKPTNINRQKLSDLSVVSSKSFSSNRLAKSIKPGFFSKIIQAMSKMTSGLFADVLDSVGIDGSSTPEMVPLDLTASTTEISDVVSTTTNNLSTSTESRVSDSDTVSVTYETPAPVIAEATTDTGKVVTVSAEETDTQIKNVLAYTNIPKIYKVGQESKIKIKWVNNDGQAMPFKAYDLNGDGYLDYLEWTVPHLSTQTFDIIFISKAFQLDSEQNIVADVYDQVQKQDNIYATIPSDNYIRTTFYQTLDSTKDITVYAKPTDSNTSAGIEVFPVYTDADGNQTEGPQLNLVSDGINTDFSNIDHSGKYRILLSNLQTPTDMFDLKVVGNIDFNYIVDPGDIYTGLVAHYKMNDNLATKNVLDNTGNGHTGTAQRNTNLLSVSGKIYTALSFNNSSDSIAVPYDSSFPKTTDFTYSAWIKTSSSAETQHIIYSGNSTNEEPISFYLYNGNLTIEYYKTGLSDYYARGNVDLRDGGWHNVVATRNGSIFDIYVDGIEARAVGGDGALTITGNTNNLYIGSRFGTDHFFDGSIDDVRIYNRALAGLDITALYNGGLGTESQGTTDTYTLSYTAGSNGTLTGSTTQTVNYSTNGTAVTANPDSGYHFVNWSDASTTNPRTDTNVTNNITVTANFASVYNCPGADGNNDLTISSDTTWSSSIDYTCNNLTINNNATLYLDSATAGKNIVINATNLTVATGSAISSDAKGSLYDVGTGKGGAGSWGGGGGGAGYGGVGGAGTQGVGGSAYGDVNYPTDLGSGGGSGSYAGQAGKGGGAMKLVVTGTLTNSGTISANGGSAGTTGPTNSGGGSGGSIWINANNLYGNGLISSNGGDGKPSGNGTGGGGAGGRIAIYVTGFSN